MILSTVLCLGEKQRVFAGKLSLEKHVGATSAGNAMFATLSGKFVPWVFLPWKKSKRVWRVKVSKTRDLCAWLGTN